MNLENDAVRIGFDPDSGAIAFLENLVLDRRIDMTARAAAPVRLLIADGPGGSGTATAAVTRADPQRPACELYNSGPDTCLRQTWPDIKAGNVRTGIKLDMEYTLSPGEPAARIKTRVENRGPRRIAGLFLGLEDLAPSDDPKKERIMAGDMGGAPYAAPRVSLPREEGPFGALPAGSRSFSIPPTTPAGMAMGWMNYGDDSIGIGLGYLNRQGIAMVGAFKAEGSRLAIGWRLFRLADAWSFMWASSGTGQVYPLEPGETFESDEWFVALHEGDWHHTADLYRKRYEAVFRGDFLAWEETSPAVRRNDIVLNSFAAWGKSSKDPSRAYDYPEGVAANKFEDLPGRVADVITALNVAPENTVVNVLGTGTDWGIYRMPDHFPMCEAAGGQAAGERMCRRIRETGVAGICFYAHPCFMHRKARRCVAEADTGAVYPQGDWQNSMGGIACMDSDAWQDVWIRGLYPEFLSAGATALYWDEGFTHHMICTRPEHPHGVSALKTLTAQSRGANRLYRAWRRIAGSGGHLACEGASDVQARLVDLWHLGGPPATIRYTHPDKMIMTAVSETEGTAGVANVFLMGCPILLNAFPMPGGGLMKLEGEFLHALRRFVAIRREMRERQSPGYPHGFRDETGLRAAPPGLRCKVYADANGITVAHFAAAAAAGDVVVDAARLGHPTLGIVRRNIMAQPGGMGCLEIRR